MKSKTRLTEPQGKIKKYAMHLIFIFLLIGTLGAGDTFLSLVEIPNVSPHPLRVGEKITYNISVKKISAIQRTDRIVKEESMNGETVYHIQSKMKTRALFRFYKFDRQEETYLNLKTLSPVRYRRQSQKGKHRTTVTIDFRGETAEYENTSRPKPKSPETRDVKVLETPPGTQNELSALYFLRSKQLSVGKTYFFSMITEGEVKKITVTVEDRDRVKNKKLGTVETLVLRTSTGGIYWFTEGERRLIVKAETQKEGSTVKMTLTDIEFTGVSD